MNSKQLEGKDEATCELFESIGSCAEDELPQIADLNLHEAIWRTARTAAGENRLDVLGYALRTLGLLAKRSELLQTFMYSLPNALNFMLELLDQFRQDTTTCGNVLYFLHTTTELTGWHGKNKLVKLMDSLFGLVEGGFVYKEEDKPQVGPMWKLTWSVLIQLTDVYVQYNYRDAENDARWAKRVLAIVDKNFKHWECYYALAFFTEPMGLDVLRQMDDLAVQTLVKLLSWHTKGGLERCTSRVCSERKVDDDENGKSAEQASERQKRRKKKRMAPPKLKMRMKREGDWGFTMDLGIDILINLLLTTEKNEKLATARFEALVPLALREIDKYLVPNPEIDLSVAKDAIDSSMQECYNRNGVVRLLIEIVGSHLHHKGMVFKLCNLLFFITYGNQKEFRTNELYLEGRGPVVFLEAMKEDLADESIENLEAHCTRFVAPLILLARKVDYKESLMVNVDALFVLLHTAFELGLQLLVYLEKGSNEVKRRMRDEFKLDERVITLSKKSEWSGNPIALKQVVDLLIGIKSPRANALVDFISPEMLVAMAYYWTPRSVGRQLVFDPNPEDTLTVVTRIVNNLEQWVKQVWKNDGNVADHVPPSLLPVLEAGFVTTIATLLWAVPDDSPVWQAATGCAFHLFQLEEQGVQERLAADFLRERKKAPFSPATLQRYKEYLNHPSFDQGLWSFVESLFLPAFRKRGLDFSKEIIAPPDMMAGMQRAFGGVRPGARDAPKPTGTFVELDPTARRCEYCHMKRDTLQRCGRCKQVYFCDRICQKRGWSDHKQSCQKPSE